MPAPRPAPIFDREAALAQLFSMLRVDSTWGNEGRLAVALASDLERAGFDEVQLIEPLPGRASVVGRIRGTGGGKSIILNGHLDIYELSRDWTRDPFAPAIEDGKIFGAGIADEKAGTAGLLAAACEFIEPGHRPPGDIIFMGVSAHFEGGLGTRAVLDSGITADGGITCEGSHLALNESHRGAVYLDITTYGKQAHTTSKHEGINAIEAMVPVIEGLEKLEFPHTPDSLGGPILNVGTIHGGTKHNQVPDRCQISVDVRVPVTLEAETVVRGVHQLLDEVAAGRPGFRASVDYSPYWLSGPRLPSATTDSEAIVQSVQSACAQIGLPSKAHATLPVWSDMCVLNQRGIPTVNIGPGGPPYNWADEFVSVDEYFNAVGIYIAAIRDFCNRPA
jgi:acetylornithine deacetylase/succinyl-diaminopimelate desuccinylase-like protein